VFFYLFLALSGVLGRSGAKALIFEGFPVESKIHVSEIFFFWDAPVTNLQRIRPLQTSSNVTLPKSIEFTWKNCFDPKNRNRKRGFGYFGGLFKQLH
jgi:hypothetical protein